MSFLELWEAGQTDASAVESATGMSVLTLAIKRGMLSLVRMLLAKGADVNAACAAGTPLSHAAALGHIDIFIALLKAGADVTALLGSNDLLSAPSLWAVLAPHVTAEQKPQFMQLRSAEGDTPLMRAIQHSEAAAVCILDDWHAAREDIVAANAAGHTALYFAAPLLGRRQSPSPTPCAPLPAPRLPQASPLRRRTGRTGRTCPRPTST